MLTTHWQRWDTQNNQMLNLKNSSTVTPKLLFKAIVSFKTFMNYFVFPNKREKLRAFLILLSFITHQSLCPPEVCCLSVHWSLSVTSLTCIHANTHTQKKSSTAVAPMHQLISERGPLNASFLIIFLFVPKSVSSTPITRRSQAGTGQTCLGHHSVGKQWGMQISWDDGAKQEMATLEKWAGNL